MIDAGQRYDEHRDGIINRIADIRQELTDLDEADVIIRNMVQNFEKSPIDSDLKIGNIVFVREMIPQGKLKKFAQKFVGPYIITGL